MCSWSTIQFKDTDARFQSTIQFKDTDACVKSTIQLKDTDARVHGQPCSSKIQMHVFMVNHSVEGHRCTYSWSTFQFKDTDASVQSTIQFKDTDACVHGQPFS